MENKSNCKIIELNVAKELAHGICVSNLACRVARELGLPPEVCYELAVSGLLHDLGKLEVAKYIYAREEDTLHIEEMKYVRTHSTLSYTMLVKRGYSKFILESILYHHENFDGSGYPSNLVGEEIPLGARIIRVCDVFAALTTDRPYRRSFDMDTAVELMIEEVKNFDMKIFLAFLNVIHQEDIEDILDKKELQIDLEEEML